MRHILFFTLLLAGCQAANDGGQMEEATPMVPPLADHVATAAANWNTSWTAGDAAAIGESYDDGAVAYPPNSDPVEGKAAITEFWGGVIGAGLNGRIETLEATNNGDLGYEVGNYGIEDSTGAHLDHGNFVVVWKYVDGSWKMFRDTWNTNMPAQ